MSTDPLQQLTALIDEGRWDWALAEGQALLAQNPNDLKLLAQVGQTHARLGQFAEARQCFARQAELDGGSAAALNNLGGLAMREGDSRTAAGLFDAALATDPEHMDARFNRGLCRLRLGAFREGFADYEARWSAWGIAKPQLGVPEWPGQDHAPIAGKTLLLYTEQGRGDLFQFLRMCPAIARLGGHPILICPPDMGAICAGTHGLAGLLPAGAPLPQADYACALMSVPHRLGWGLADLSTESAYLDPDPDAVAAAEVVLSTRYGTDGDSGGYGTGARIAMAWRGNPRHRMNHERSWSMAEMAATVGAVPEVGAMVALHPDQTAEDGRAERIACGLIDPDPDPDWRQRAFVAASGLISACDVTVTVDTAFAHLAGALGRPAVVLLPADPDWRWGERGLNSPWYPTLTLVRRRVDEPGDAYIQRIQSTLSTLLQVLRSSSVTAVGATDGSVPWG